jgi:hypothetical protein
VAAPSVQYDGKKIIPVSGWRLERVYERSADGSSRRRGWQVTLNGVLLPGKGSPDATGAFWTGSGYPPDTAAGSLGEDELFDILKRKKQALARLFSVDGLNLDVVPPNGGTRYRMQPRWGTLSFAEGREINHLPWAISLDCDSISPLDDADEHDQAKNPPEETWQLERVDDAGRQYRLTHTVSAQGKKRFDASGAVVAQGWEVAKDLCLGGATAGGSSVSKLGYQAPKADPTGLLSLSGFGAYNRQITHQIDEAAGRFTVNESWLLFDPADLPTGLTGGAAVEDYQVESRYAADTGLTSVTVSGTINGLEQRHPTTNAVVSSRWANASTRAAGITEAWALGLAQTVSGVTLCPRALSTTISRNRVSGVISYTASFDNRQGPSDPSEVFRSSSIEFQNAADVIAEIPVPFRAAGPILQNCFTVTRRVVTVNIEVVKQAVYGGSWTVPANDPLALALAAIGYTPTQMYMIADSTRATLETGRWSRSSTFIFQ